MRTSLIMETQCIMRQIPPINRHTTELPKPFFVFVAGNNHTPLNSFPYRFLCNLLQKCMRAHDKYGIIMPKLVQTLRDCSSKFTSVDPYSGALSGAPDLGRRARICKWVALVSKFIFSPIQNAGNPLRPFLYTCGCADVLLVGGLDGPMRAATLRQ